ncbi:MAG: hypothetical protein ABEN55_04000 [Bradymonadaceae bacterium]
MHSFYDIKDRDRVVDVLDEHDEGHRVWFEVGTDELLLFNILNNPAILRQLRKERAITPSKENPTDIYPCWMAFFRPEYHVDQDRHVYDEDGDKVGEVGHPFARVVHSDHLEEYESHLEEQGIRKYVEMKPVRIEVKGEPHPDSSFVAMCMEGDEVVSIESFESVKARRAWVEGARSVAPDDVEVYESPGSEKLDPENRTKLASIREAARDQLDIDVYPWLVEVRDE